MEEYTEGVKEEAKIKWSVHPRTQRILKLLSDFEKEWDTE